MRDNMIRRMNGLFTRVITISLLLAIGGLLLPAPANAEKVSLETARLVAERHLEYYVATFGNWGESAAPKIAEQEVVTYQGIILAYNFTVAPSGHVLISAWDEFSPVMLYSLTSEFVPSRVSTPSSPESWIIPEMYATYQQIIVKRSELKKKIVYAETPVGQAWAWLRAETFSPTLKNGATAKNVGPLLTTVWDQGDPYNWYTPPAQGCSHTLTGCVATATAQLMKYWNWPEMGEGSFSYPWNGQTLSANFEHRLDWTNMIDNPYWWGNDTQKSAVARLMVDVGIASEMDYDCSSSGSKIVTAGAALATHFRYKRGYPRTHRDHPTDWFDLFRTEFDADPPRPILFALNSSGGGHAVVVDGYQTGATNKVHLNMGWSGSWNAWYDITNNFATGIWPIDYQLWSSDYIYTNILPEPIETTPPSPSTMTWSRRPYAASSTSITMTAQTVTDDTPPVYYLFSSMDNEIANDVWISTSQTSNSYTNTGLQPNHQYSYRVRAYDSALEYDYRNRTWLTAPNATTWATTWSVYTLANLPTAAAYSNVGPTSIQANWGANSNRAGTEYSVDYCLKIDSQTCNLKGSSGWMTNTTWAASGLACGGTTYKFRVKARNWDGIDTTWVELGEQATSVCPDTTAPSPNPMTWAVEPTAASSTSISMTATTATDAQSSPVSYFFDFVSSSNNGSGGSDSAWQSGASYTNSGLQPNHRYSYCVKARDAASPSNVTNCSTTVAAYTDPNPPVAAGFSNVTQTSIQVNWDANGNPAWTEYYVDTEYDDNDSGWITGTSWTATGLTCNRSYSFRVRTRPAENTYPLEWVSLGGVTTAPCNNTVPPVIMQGTAVSVTMSEDGSPTAWVAPIITATDADSTDSLSWSLLTGPANGVATVTGIGFSPVTLYTPNADFNGADSFVVQVSDGVLTDSITVNVTISAVNDAPSFITGADQNGAAGAGPQTVVGWATDIAAGPANEDAQTLTFTATASDPALFTTQPTIDAVTGTLTYTPNTASIGGNVTITVTLQDNGGTTNGGQDTSEEQTFLITVKGRCYVNAAASGANTGSSWANAYTDLQSALTDTACGEVWVAEGTYTPTTDGNRGVSFSLKSGVQLYGGFAGTETERSQRNWTAHETILSGDLNGDDEASFAYYADNSYHVLIGSNTDSSAVLDGFTITGGYADGWGTGVSYGGGMYSYDGSPTVTNCIFRDNYASWVGGGMYSWLGSPTVTNCVFRGNSVGTSGGGMYNNWSNPTVTNCAFSGNSSVSLGSTGGGIGNNSSTLSVTNTIVWGNTQRQATSSQIHGSNSTLTVTYCDVQGGYNGTGNLNVNPLFVDATNGDLRIQPESPVVDKGLNSALPEDTSDLDGDGDTSESIPYDLARQSRIVRSLVDMGAYEQQTPNVAPTDLTLTGSTVEENSPIGTTVGTFATTDPDPGNTFTYTLVEGDGSGYNEWFTVVDNTLLTSTLWIDYEFVSSAHIRVRTTDQGGLFFEQSFTITVTDVNEAPYMLTLTPDTVNENQPVGTTVGTLSAIDDAGDTHTYELVSGDGDSGNSAFWIDGDTLRTNAALDYEAQNSYSIRVRATDQEGLFSEQVLIITVSDLAETFFILWTK